MSLRLIRGFTLYVNDDHNTGLEIETLKLPVLEEITETFQPGGSDMEIEITGLGTKAFTMPFKLKSHSPDIIGLFAGPAGTRQHWTGKKLVIDEDGGTEHEHALDLTGRLSKVDAEALAGGKATGYDYEVKGIWNYTEYWDGRVMHRFSMKKGGWDIWNFNPVNTARRQILFS